MQYLSATRHELCRQFLDTDQCQVFCVILHLSKSLSSVSLTCVYRQMAVGDPLAATPSPQLPQSRIPSMTAAMQLQESCHSQGWVLHSQAAGLPLSLAEGLLQLAVLAA